MPFHCNYIKDCKACRELAKLDSVTDLGVIFYYYYYYYHYYY